MSRKRFLGAMALIAMLAAAVMAAPLQSAAASGSSDCQTYWGSIRKQQPSKATARLVDLRAGRHRCFDRLVVDLDRGPSGYTVAYVDRVVEQGRGHEVPLRGGAFLEVLVGAPAHDDAGRPTYQPSDPSEAVSVGGFDTFRQVAFVNSFEGQSQIGVGVRARLPFRVFTLDGPDDRSRLVIDVAHRWPPDVPTPPPILKVFFSTGDGSDCSKVTGFERHAEGVKAPIRYVLDQLVAGPDSSEIAAGASSHFSAATADAIRSIKLDDGLLVVDFIDIRNLIPNASTSCGSVQLLSELSGTVFRFPEVERVRYQINGSCETFFEWLQSSCTELRR